MAASIAKLAILLTADTSGLTTGLTRAQGLIKGFGLNATPGGASNFLSLFAKGAGPIAAVGLSLAGVYRFLRLGVTAGAEFEKQMAGVNAQADTLSARSAALHQSLSGLAATLTGPLRSGLAQVADSFSQVFDQMTRDLGGTTGAQMAKMLEMRKKSVELAKQEQEAQEKAAKAAQEAHAKLIESMQERGRALTESLRTPTEVFADTINELQKLVGKGFIDPTTFTRGTAKAKADLLDAMKVAKEFKRITDTRVGATERFSQAGFSAVQAGRAELIGILAAEKMQLEEGKKHTKLLEEVADLTRRRKPVTITRNRL